MSFGLLLIGDSASKRKPAVAASFSSEPRSRSSGMMHYLETGARLAWCSTTPIRHPASWLVDVRHPPAGSPVDASYVHCGNVSTTSAVPGGQIGELRRVQLGDDPTLPR